MSIELTQFYLEKGIRIRISANYHPHGNGLAESTNKNLLKILKRTISAHHHDWHTELLNSLWADSVTPKVAIGNSPFFLVYWTEAILPPNLFLHSLQLAQSVQDEECPTMEKRINTLLKLEEEREKSKQHFTKHQQIVKSWFDQSFSSNWEFRRET